MNAHPAEIIGADVRDSRVSRAVRELIKNCKHRPIYFTPEGAGESAQQCPRCGFWIPAPAPATGSESQVDFPFDFASLRRRNDQFSPGHSTQK
jgi:hypothetical protein